MRLLVKPALDAAKVYDSCVDEVAAGSLKSRLTNARADVLVIATEYAERAAVSDLHLSTACKWGDEDQVIVGGLKKKELNDLYSFSMVKSKDAARTHYNQLMLTPHSRCPFCGFGHVSTLDHFLAKAYYPAFSVLPINLIPSCKDCNTGKGSRKVTLENQLPHPYFESDRIESDRWLIATVVQTSPATVNYVIRPPADWPAALAVRISNHFRELDLASRFAVQAGPEIISIGAYLANLPTLEAIRSHLQIMSQVELDLHKNNWKAALYVALASSDWYCAGGWQVPTTSP